MPLMRMCFVVLVAVSTLLASSDAVLASDQTSMWTSTSINSVQVEGAEKRFLRSYDMSDLNKKDIASEEERLDTTKLDDLISADKIKAALNSVDNQDTLFATWFKDDAMSKAILAKLQTNFKKNQDIIFKYNDYRTRLTFNQVLDGWLHTKTLDDMLNALDSKGPKQLDKMRETFGAWYSSGKTAAQVEKAIKETKNAARAKRYKVLAFYYDGFVKLQ